LTERIRQSQKFEKVGFYQEKAMANKENRHVSNCEYLVGGIRIRQSNNGVLIKKPKSWQH
jgi:hypothetical protein